MQVHSCASDATSTGKYLACLPMFSYSSASLFYFFLDLSNINIVPMWTCEFNYMNKATVLSGQLVLTRILCSSADISNCPFQVSSFSLTRINKYDKASTSLLPWFLATVSFVPLLFGYSIGDFNISCQLSYPQ